MQLARLGEVGLDVAVGEVVAGNLERADAVVAVTPVTRRGEERHVRGRVARRAAEEEPFHETPMIMMTTVIELEKGRSVNRERRAIRPRLPICTYWGTMHPSMWVGPRYVLVS